MSLPPMSQGGLCPSAASTVSPFSPEPEAPGTSAALATEMSSSPMSKMRKVSPVPTAPLHSA